MEYSTTAASGEQYDSASCYGCNNMILLPVMAVFFIPVILGIYDLYHWSHTDIDHLIQKKTAFLNVPFFIIRAVLYFLIWFIFTYSLYRISINQDRKFQKSQIDRMKNLSASGMILFALTLTLLNALVPVNDPGLEQSINFKNR